MAILNRNHLIPLFLLGFLFLFGNYPANAQQVTKAEFMENPFPERISPEKLMQQYWWRVRETVEAVKSKHGGHMDTIRTVHIGGSEIAFYEGRNNTFLLSGTIRNRRISMRSGIRIWMPADGFFNRFKDIADPDKSVVTIKDKEGFYRYTFSFKWNRLRKVEFRVYPD